MIGIDESPEMLEIARRRVPECELHEADLRDLPLADGSVDLVLCSLALSHVPDLTRALHEFVRVLRPGGCVVISDSCGLIGDIGLPLVRLKPDGTFGYMPVWSRLTSHYLAAALPLGLQVRRCDEVRQQRAILGDRGEDLEDGGPSPEHIAGGAPDIWALHPFCPAATNAAWLGKPRVIVLHFQLSAAGSRCQPDCASVPPWTPTRSRTSWSSRTRRSGSGSRRRSRRGSRAERSIASRWA